MHLWLRLGIIQVNLASALALHKHSLYIPRKRGKPRVVFLAFFL